MAYIGNPLPQALRPSEATQPHLARIGGFGMSQFGQSAANFGPSTVRAGGSFDLTDQQVRRVLTAVTYGHPPNEEIYFFIHRNLSAADPLFRIGPAHLYPGGKDKAVFSLRDAAREAKEVTQAAKDAGAPAATTRYIPAGYGHSHPDGNGRPSPTDLKTFLIAMGSTEAVAMVVGEGSMPRPAKVSKILSKGRRPPKKRRVLDASIMWREAVSGAVSGIPSAASNSHRSAAAALKAAAPGTRSRYFQGELVYDGGRFSGSFSEVV